LVQLSTRKFLILTHSRYFRLFYDRRLLCCRFELKLRDYRNQFNLFQRSKHLRPGHSHYLIELARICALICIKLKTFHSVYAYPSLSLLRLINVWFLVSILQEYFPKYHINLSIKDYHHLRSSYPPSRNQGTRILLISKPSDPSTPNSECESNIYEQPRLHNHWPRNLNQSNNQCDLAFFPALWILIISHIQFKHAYNLPSRTFLN